MRNSLRIRGSLLNWAPAAFAVLAACSDGAGDDGDADNTAPSVQIVSPADGSSFVETNTITVSVQVSDPDESDLSVLDLAWGVDSSTSPGPAQADGSGAASYDLTLAVGSHEIAVTVTDPAGETAITNIILVVGADADGDGYGPPEDCDDTNPDI